MHIRLASMIERIDPKKIKIISEVKAKWRLHTPKRQVLVTFQPIARDQKMTPIFQHLSFSTVMFNEDDMLLFFLRLFFLILLRKITFRWTLLREFSRQPPVSTIPWVQICNIKKYCKEMQNTVFTECYYIHIHGINGKPQNL
jgi:hypothetical protein